MFDEVLKPSVLASFAFVCRSAAKGSSAEGEVVQARARTLALSALPPVVNASAVLTASAPSTRWR